jgi:hypothetical protein
MEAIKSAYKRLAKRYHPDVSNINDAGYRMRLINEAYDVLGNPLKKIVYDFIFFGQRASPLKEGIEYSMLGTEQPVPSPGILRQIISELVITLVGWRTPLGRIILIIAAIAVILSFFYSGAAAVELMRTIAIIVIMRFILIEIPRLGGIRPD